MALISDHLFSLPSPSPLSSPSSFSQLLQFPVISRDVGISASGNHTPYGKETLLEEETVGLRPAELCYKGAVKTSDV
jgi:isopenicillin N synthase-like dioxygenase